MAIDRGDIVTALGRWLKDSGYGDYTEAELQSIANEAIVASVVAGRTYKEAVSKTLVAATATYSAEPCFEITLVSLGGQALNYLRDNDPALQEWDGAVAGVPKAWRQKSGMTIEVSPTPSSGATGLIGTINPTPTAGGTGYVVGDLLSVTTGGTGGKVKVASVSGGVVTGLELIMGDRSQRGTGYTTGAGKVTSADTGSGTGCTVNITALAKLEIIGYCGIAEPSDDETDITAIPEAYFKQVVLPLGLAMALEHRRTGSVNLTLAEAKYQQWAQWTERMAISLRPKVGQ